MTETRTVSLRETLDVNQFQNVGSKIAGLPTPDGFREQVEDDLWETFTGSNTLESDRMEYCDLPEESKSVIGYVEEEDGDQFTPWWLRSFEWTASSRGEELVLEKEWNSNELSKFENFDPDATIIHKPKLRDETILAVLEAFGELHDALDERIGIEHESSELKLPSNIFEIGDKSVRTTGEFESWFNSLLRSCPPIDDELTSLLMINTGVRREAVNDMIPAEILDRIDKLGFSDGEIFERDYHNPLMRVMEIQGVFDLTVPESEKSDDLGGLEALLYRKWTENFDGDREEGNEWIERASDWNPDELEEGKEPMFGRIAFSIPLRLKQGRPVYTTCSVYSQHGPQFGYENRGNKRAVDDIMESSGYLE